MMHSGNQTKQALWRSYHSKLDVDLPWRYWRKRDGGGGVGGEHDLYLTLNVID